MADELTGKRIAILATDGVEQVELTEPRKAVERAGATTVLISLEEGELLAFDHIDHADTFPIDTTVRDVDASEYDGLIVPGGVANGDVLRADEHAVAFVKAFFDQEKPVGAICHAPWVLIEAGVARGRRMTSFPSLQTDLRNAGAEWVDEEVVEDRGVITSRNPDDIPAFSAALVGAFAATAAGTAPQAS
jgi:protease I